MIDKVGKRDKISRPGSHWVFKGIIASKHHEDHSSLHRRPEPSLCSSFNASQSHITDHIKGIHFNLDWHYDNSPLDTFSIEPHPFKGISTPRHQTIQHPFYKRRSGSSCRFWPTYEGNKWGKKYKSLH